MPTVRDAALDLFRAHGMTTVFGNPGSTELPMLADWPSDFRYILGLQEAVVVGMADGYAQVTRRPTHVNLHTAPGVGNGVGAIYNAQANRSPLVITAGQQARHLMTMEALLTNRDATVVPQPFVKWSYEPPRAQDVPAALARAIATSTLPPLGPTFVSIPMHDWREEADPDGTAHATARRVTGRAVADPALVAGLAARLKDARAPALVCGPDADGPDGWGAAVALAEAQRLPVYAAPTTTAYRIGFPEDHPQFQGILPPAIGPVGQVLAPYDLVLCAGTQVFPYYPDIPGPLLAEGTALVAITSDPADAARAPMGDAIVADVALTLEALLAAAGAAEHRAPPPVVPAPAPPEETEPLGQAAVIATLADVMPDGARIVLESPASTFVARARLRLGHPGSWMQAGGGGLGFGLAAAVGAQLAQPSRPTIGVIGEGSAQYAITALWTAAAYEIPVTILVVRNDEYSILKWFGTLEGAEGAPGLDLPALETADVARAYGVESVTVRAREELREALRDAIAANAPRVVEVAVAPGMAIG